MKVAFFIFLACITTSVSQISGCTDSLSKNYNPKATVNDGSCCYKKAKIKADFSVKLSDSLTETSTLFYYDSLLWTANDDTDATIYGLNFAGMIEKKVKIKGLKNKEWEEISQDNDYIYLGDFGNNSHGNRTDLRILRLAKNEFYSNTVKIDTISFSYGDQTDLSSQKPNKTNFDCEAFIVIHDSIYLFTKHFNDRKTTIYSLPKLPGKYVAKLKETYNTKGMITGSCYFENTNNIVLTGYNKHLQPFLYLLYNFHDTYFFSGNKRKIKLKLPFHQIEGITTTDGLQYFFTNEKAVKKPLFNVIQQLHHVDLSMLLNLKTKH